MIEKDLADTAAYKGHKFDTRESKTQVNKFRIINANILTNPARWILKLSSCSNYIQSPIVGWVKETFTELVTDNNRVSDLTVQSTINFTKTNKKKRLDKRTKVIIRFSENKKIN